MSNPITGNDLIALGYQQGYIIGEALKINKKRTGFNRNEMISFYRKVLHSPQEFLDHKVFSSLAKAILNVPEDNLIQFIELKKDANSYSIYGEHQIEDGARLQMDVAMKLPVTVAGALMPDAHQGYGLPIGGVLATKNSIIPYGVGVDIGCRMALSIFDIQESYFEEHKSNFKKILIDNTIFGAGNGYKGRERSEHEVLDRQEFKLTSFIKNLQDKAWSQLGTSGGGNHFVEWGIIDIKKDDPDLNIKQGKFLALLTHSGSRGLGAMIANHYTRLAKEICPLPKEASNLAFMNLDTEEGNEYWLAMNLAGAYASACHEIIHKKMIKASGAFIIAQVENHHNFAWKEIWNGEEVIVHRKGATPAGEGVLGIIPGSMTAPGFLVKGKGNSQSIFSASHGAGRQMSRTKAIQNISRKEMNEVLKENKVELIGAGIDEAPMAYKDIHSVMAAQSDLVDIIGQFQPRIVRMADDGSSED